MTNYDAKQVVEFTRLYLKVLGASDIVVNMPRIVPDTKPWRASQVRLAIKNYQEKVPEDVRKEFGFDIDNLETSLTNAIETPSSDPFRSASGF